MCTAGVLPPSATFLKDVYKRQKDARLIQLFLSLFYLPCDLIVFRGMVPVPAFIELFGGFFYELVQLIQVDICEYGRNDAALRAAGVGSMVLPCLLYTSFYALPIL